MGRTPPWAPQSQNLLGVSGAGKTLTIEGSRARDSKSSSEGDGIVHLAVDALYKLLNDKAVSVGGCQCGFGGGTMWFRSEPETDPLIRGR